MNSAIYKGVVRHRRFAPTQHAFNYSLFMMFLDLDELDFVFSKTFFWSSRQFNLAYFRRNDYLEPHKLSLKEAVKEKVKTATGAYPQGPIRMLTHLRYFGYCFNPVTFYYCYSENEKTVETIVADITNTPWKEKHAYVLSPSLNEGKQTRKRYRFAKKFHISPFMPMDLDYDWHFTDPADQLSVHMDVTRSDTKLFDSTLTMKKEEITPARLNFLLLSYPFMTFQVLFGIYFQSLLLKIKKTPYFKHPKYEEKDKNYL